MGACMSAPDYAESSYAHRSKEIRHRHRSVGRTPKHKHKSAQQQSPSQTFSTTLQPVTLSHTNTNTNTYQASISSTTTAASAANIPIHSTQYQQVRLPSETQLQTQSQSQSQSRSPIARTISDRSSDSSNTTTSNTSDDTIKATTKPSKEAITSSSNVDTSKDKESGKRKKEKRIENCSKKETKSSKSRKMFGHSKKPAIQRQDSDVGGRSLRDWNCAHNVENIYSVPATPTTYIHYPNDTLQHPNQQSYDNMRAMSIDDSTEDSQHAEHPDFSYSPSESFRTPPRTPSSQLATNKSSQQLHSNQQQPQPQPQQSSHLQHPTHINTSAPQATLPKSQSHSVLEFLHQINSPIPLHAMHSPTMSPHYDSLHDRSHLKPRGQRQMLNIEGTGMRKVQSHREMSNAGINQANECEQQHHAQLYGQVQNTIKET